MRNIIGGSFILFFCMMNVSFSQTKNIEKGTYISNNKGSKIKLNLLDNNQFELVFYSGEYEIKGDSLLFKNKEKSTDVFDLTYSKDKSIKSKKVKVKFLDAGYSFYLGTQNGTQDVVYQKVNIDYNANPNQTDAELEIDRSDFIYLVHEGYEGSSNVSKYSLPTGINNVIVKYSPDLMGDFNLSGYLDPKTNQLTLGEKGGKNPLVFQPEKEAKSSVSNSKITPVEFLVIPNWTYPGKESLINEDFGTVVPADSAVAVVESYPESKIDFKFKIENNLKDAIAATKTAKSKFLVVSLDSKNPSAKADFDSFLKEQEIQIRYNMSYVYNPEYDLFNYYLATAEDKKWLKTNKITDDPSVVVLNSDGEILAVAKSGLLDIKPEFDYYFDKRVQRANTLYSFNKMMKDKKVTDADLILAFNNAAVNELPYDYQSEDVNNDENFAKFKLVKVVLDKKEVSQTWKKLIEAHQKDTKPNKYLAETILKEIKNQGYYKQLFNEDRVLNDTDFLSIDYLLKHYDAIQKMNAEDENGHAIVLFKGNLSAEISSSLQQNISLSEEGIGGKTNQNKIIAVYKKLISAGKGDYDCYKNYFAYLSSESENAIDDISYLREFNSYFNTYLSTEKGNAIERLDEMFSGNNDPDFNYDYNAWSSFKEYHSNLSNSAAWVVVLKPANSGFIKDAINWSEYSLIVTKNNPYYLDTLAQLYYKDGQKEKAIATQTLAVKFLNTEVEEVTAAEIRETLGKMQNGTY